MIEDRIAEVLEQRFKEDDLLSCFLVDVTVGSNHKIAVFVDADNGLTIDMCRKISRHLEKHIEENKWLPDKYTLDVSSPGTDNPLKLHRQYVKNKSRKAKITLLDAKILEGKILDVNENDIDIELSDGAIEKILFENIKETKILVSLNKSE